MVLVAAMAIQNAVHRVHLASAPPSTLMTGTTTQIMIDIADLLRGLPDEPRAAGQEGPGWRAWAANVGAFALGCAAGALLFRLCSRWVFCFVVPPVVAVVALIIRLVEPKQVS